MKLKDSLPHICLAANTAESLRISLMNFVTLIATIEGGRVEEPPGDVLSALRREATAMTGQIASEVKRAMDAYERAEKRHLTLAKMEVE